MSEWGLFLDRGSTPRSSTIAIFNGMPFSNLTLCEQVIIDGKPEFVRQEGDL